MSGGRTDPGPGESPTGAGGPVASGAAAARRRARLGLETLGVLAVCLGRSAVYAVLSILDKLTLGPALGEQTTTINGSTTPDRPWLDLCYKLADYLFLAAPVVIVLYLLTAVRRPGHDPWRAIGLDRTRPGRDVGVGVALAAAIGIPGLAFYLFARRLGINTDVAAGNLAEHVWTIPVYVLAAFANGLLEETVMVAYLLTRWRQCGWRPGAAVAVSALLRGSYHLYQGFGGLLGNAVMGVACCLYWTRARRLWPLIVAHTLLDVFSFVGYALLHGVVGWL